jgi:hypothetical protein
MVDGPNKVTFDASSADKANGFELWPWFAGAILLINFYTGLSVYGVFDIHCLTSMLRKLTAATITDQKNFLAGFQATSAILCVLLDYFNPPRRGTPLMHTNKLPRVAAGLLAISSGIFWTLTGLSTS